MQEIRLKSCPFCAFRRPIILTHKNDINVSYSVKCDLKNGGCGCETRRMRYVEDAVRQWNMRAYK